MEACLQLCICVLCISSCGNVGSGHLTKVLRINLCSHFPDGDEYGVTGDCMSFILLYSTPLYIIVYVCICKVFYDFNVSSFRRDLGRARTVTPQVCMDKGVIV